MNDTSNETVERSATPIQPSRKHARTTQSVSEQSTSAATIVAKGMKDAVNQLKERDPVPDGFDSFGKFVASEIRAIRDAEIARRVRFKVNRFLLDTIEEEYQSMSRVIILDDMLLSNENETEQ